MLMLALIMKKKFALSNEDSVKFDWYNLTKVEFSIATNPYLVWLLLINIIVY